MPFITLNPPDALPIKIWSKLSTVEQQAVDQLVNVAKLPWAFHHVAVMPDVHSGRGCTIGSVIATKDAISPATVGVDIGCGMAAIKTNLTSHDLPDDLKLIRHRLERDIPVGFEGHSEPIDCSIYDFSKRWNRLWRGFDGLHNKVQESLGKAKKQLGTLGGGNHFIELCIDTNDNVWLMLHSGSRNIGKTLAEIHIGIAKKLSHNQDLPDPDLAVFIAQTPQMEAYRNDLMWAQEYAMLNRMVMIELYKSVLKKTVKHVKFEQEIYCHHNYVSEETHFGVDVFVTRKGAISAAGGQFGIIPGSMGAKSFIVKGLGNPESFNSASHGAGRKMSRGAAKRLFTVADLEKQTEGVECRKDKDVLDEIPGAYKDIKEVMENQSDLVEIVAELKQVMCVKGN
jgi:tRNA-splicing ligase RtcB (3'-phosphate/5'-hydroxy nucleic acid ligase)